MSIRIRKLIGTFALFALVIVWALIAMAVAQFPPIFNNAVDRGGLLRRRRHRLGVAGDAADQMDVEAGCAQVTLTRAEAVPQSGRGARDQHLGVARAAGIRR